MKGHESVWSQNVTDLHTGAAAATVVVAAVVVVVVVLVVPLLPLLVK